MPVRPGDSAVRPRLGPRAGGGIAPFIKWAGGKGQLLRQLLPLAPAAYERYFEPFVGGGAVYFALRPERAVLGDLNAELVGAYEVVRDDVDGLIACLDAHRHDRDYYYAVRQQEPASLSKVEQAARFIFLNKTGYNGLYRVNRRGQFNVPFGRYKTPPRLYDEQNLRAASALLAGATLIVGTYLATLAAAAAGDFVYLDPPYQPLSASANFTRYTRHGFKQSDQEALADEFRRLDRLGCQVMLSNSDSPLVWTLYQGFELREVRANRLINSKGAGRVGITEMVIRNYA